MSTALERPAALNILFNTAKSLWVAACVSQSVSSSNFYVPGIIVPGSMSGSQYHCKVTTVTHAENQSTLADETTYGPGKRRFEAVGFLGILLFFPISADQSYFKGNLIAQSMKKGLRSHLSNNSIWLRDPRIKEVPSEELFYRLNVLVDFQYDELS